MRKRTLPRWLCGLACLALAPALLARAEAAPPKPYDVVPAPDWADILEPPDGSAVEADGAEQYLRVDTQIRLDKAEQAYNPARSSSGRRSMGSGMSPRMAWDTRESMS